jgi:hypothetical protein
MKKIIFVFFGLILFTTTSCNKEEIRPNAYNNGSDDRTSKDFNDQGDQSNCGNKYGGIMTSIIISDSTFVITDPNRDEDDERKVKRK